MPGRGEVTAFTGLRGAAAWWVVLYHFDEIVPVGGAAWGVVRQGYRAVDLFFIMSGFVLALRYGEAFRAGAGARRWVWFMVLRLGRVYPLHVAVMLLYLSVPLALLATGRPLVDHRFLPGTFLSSVLLVQDWGVPGLFSWNLPSWSISAELAFYLLFPFAATVVGGGLRGRAGVVVLGVVIFGGILVVGGLSGGFVFRTGRWGVVRCLVECLLGMWLWRAVGLWPPGRVGSRVLLGASAALAGLYAGGVAPDHAVVPLGFVCLLAGVTEPGCWASRVLSMRVPAFLGAISFSTYMVHYLVKDWTKLLVVGRVPGVAVFLVYAGAVLVGSVVLHRFVEVPGRAFSRRVAAGIVQGPFRKAPGTAV